jgi:hypothetical protein
MADSVPAAGRIRRWEQATSETSTGRLPIAVLLAIGVVAGASWAFAHRGLPWELWSGDACEYAEMGRRLAAGEGFTTGVIYPAEVSFGADAQHPAVMRPPLWPLALAGAFAIGGADAEIAHALTGAFFVGTVALAALLGSTLAGPVAGTVAALTLAATPAFSGLASDPVSETLFAFFVTLAFWLVASKRSAFTVGAVCACAYLTRYNGLLLLPIAMALLGLRNPRSLWTCAVGFAVVAAPWWVRNWIVTGDPFFSLLGLNLYFSPTVHTLHDSLYYSLEPDLAGDVAMHPLEKFTTQFPELMASWPLASLNLAACAAVVLACVRGQRESLAFAALALGTAVAVALALPQGRYFVPLLPVMLALGAGSWIRWGGRLALPGLVLMLLAPLLPALPAERDDIAMLRGFFRAERAAAREDPDRYVAREAEFAAMRRCLTDRPLVVAQGAARLVWETGVIAIYYPNRPDDFWQVVEANPVSFAEMKGLRKLDPLRFASQFAKRDDCGPGIWERRTK